MAPITLPGDDAVAVMEQATRQAEEHAAALELRDTSRWPVIAAGSAAVREAFAVYQRGGKVPPGNCAAWLTVALREMPVRDEAWVMMTDPDTGPENRAAHVSLWRDMTLLARPGYTAPPATLLALAAWQAGDSALAEAALGRALEESPKHLQALLLRKAVRTGASPSRVWAVVPPEHIAARYPREAWAEVGLPEPPGP